MESLPAVKLELKVENEETNLSKTRNKVKSNRVELENQPSSSSSSLNTSNTSSSISQRNSVESDSDESTGDIVDVSIPQPREQVFEVVDIDSDSSEEDDSHSTQISNPPRKAGLRQLQKRNFFKENSDSDDTDEDVISNKRTKFSDPEKVYNSLDEPCKLLKKLRKKRSEADVILEKYVRCIIDGVALSRTKLYDLEMAALREILEDHGKIIERLSLNKFYWEETKLVTDFSPFNLYALLTKFCKNLRVFKFAGPFASIKISKSPTKAIFLPNLREIYFNCGEMETAAGDNRDVILQRIYSKIFKAATSLERVEYTYLHLNEADQILKALKDSTAEVPLKCFKRLILKSGKDDAVLKEEQLSTMSNCNLPNLEHLEIGNGLWEDIKSGTFEKVLSKFSKLQTLIIHGSRQGDPSSVKSDFYVNFPRMDKLTTLSIGAEYEFESIIQTSTSNIVTINDTSLEFLKFQIRLPHMPNLKSIILGNLINIDKLTFKDFPNLQVFKVGGPWNQTCNFLAEQHWKITDLQFPDALKDSSLSKRIPEMFPSLKKLWIFLPSVFCLRGFFEAMSKAKHVKIEELYLKTQFDFESTLESCLLGRSTASLRSDEDIKNLNLLQRYSHFDDYVKYYNIELPIVKHEDNEDVSSPGIGVLKSLKVLQLEHIPRILRIPIGKYHWLDHRCILTNNFIGYRKYRLSQKCINELHVKNLHTFLWPNFEFYGSLRKFEANGLEDFSNRATGNTDGTYTNSARRHNKLRVTVQPSMLRMAEFKFKNEASK